MSQVRLTSWKDYFLFFYSFSRMHREWWWLYKLFSLCQAWSISCRFCSGYTDFLCCKFFLPWPYRFSLLQWLAPFLCCWTDAVICGHMSNTVAQSAEEDLTVLKDALQSNQTKRWQAVGMLKHIFSSANLPWELKKHTINFLLWIMDGNLSEKCNDEVSDCSSYVPGLFASLQVVSCYILVYISYFIYLLSKI